VSVHSVIETEESNKIRSIRDCCSQPNTRVCLWVCVYATHIAWLSGKNNNNAQKKSFSQRFCFCFLYCISNEHSTHQYKHTGWARSALKQKLKNYSSRTALRTTTPSWNYMARGEGEREL